MLDIPLLYEKGNERYCHQVIVVTAPFLQRQRVMRRRGMTEEKFRGTLAQQTPDAEKRRRADWVVPTGLGRSFTWHRLAAVMQQVRSSIGAMRCPADRKRPHA